MIKNIVFDMGNVLLSYRPKEYVKTITTDEAIGEALLKEFLFSEEWIMLDAGAITEEEAVKRVQARIPQYAEYVQKTMDNWHTDLTPIEGMPELVALLKEKGYKLYLLSNTSLRFYQYQPQVEMFKLFDGFFISAKERLLKPQKEIFERFLERFDLIGSECVFIDDLAENVKGAQEAGIVAHQFCGSDELKEYFKKNGIL
ncbi:HAD family phosphatase [Defluviitalea saccharophila]|uniref:HAD family phosphatase n=1 Tax=Defluviitalea saccharophila TaxID=879970 RepID=A0ABZ2Y8T8_9FIRM|nr:HAD family phosphatase [Candidatus Epulonipiscium sp.]